MALRVGILTFQWADNYGGLLQCYALKKYLQKQGHDVAVINYWPRYALNKRATRIGKSAVRKQFGVSGKPNRKQLLKSVLTGRYPYVRQMTQRMDHFRADGLSIDQHVCLDRFEIEQTIEQFDVLICGSDQIWNPVITGGRFDKAYFLDFASRKPLKIAYAASLGVTLKPEWEQEFRTLLNKIQFISTRESSLAELIQKQFGMSSKAVVDPVFLLDDGDWNQIIPAKENNEHYILVYSLQRNADIVMVANRLSEKTGLPIRVIGTRQKYKNAEYISACFMEDFLALFKNADYILTNSFHGTAFSLIFQKRFLTFLHSKKPARMRDLLTDIGLAERIYCGDNLEIVLQDPDYDCAFAALNAKICASRDFLAASISQANHIAASESIKDNEYCTGCASCSFACPKQAITMQRNEKGFLVPSVSEDKCVHCGLCLKACHLVNGDSRFSKPLSILAAKNRSTQERVGSSSGGIYPLLARSVLEAGGVVYGAAFDETNTVRHIRAETMEEALRCCQSKYVQSDAVDAFQRLIDDAKAGRKILFVGTPCQVSAVRSIFRFRKIGEENTLFVDFICHGTPSPMVFKDYLSMIEKKYKGTIHRFYFRDKEQGWRGNGYKAVFRDRKAVVNGFYLRGFNKLFSLSTNEACFHCAYSKPERVSDITLGDFWGIENTPIADFDDGLGVSMVFVNTDKGDAWIEDVRDALDLRDAELSYCIANTPLFHTPGRNKASDVFWEIYLNQGYEPAFDLFCKFTGKKGLYERFKWLVMYKLNMKDVVLLGHSKLKNRL